MSKGWIFFKSIIMHFVNQVVDKKSQEALLKLCQEAILSRLIPCCHNFSLVRWCEITVILAGGICLQLPHVIKRYVWYSGVTVQLSSAEAKSSYCWLKKSITYANRYTRLENLAWSHSVFWRFIFCRKRRFMKPFLLSSVDTVCSFI